MRFILAIFSFLEDNDGSETERSKFVKEANGRLPGWMQLLLPVGFFIVWLVMVAVLWVVVSIGELWLLFLVFGEQQSLTLLVGVGNMLLMPVVAGIFLNWASAELILWLDRRRSVVKA